MRRIGTALTSLLFASCVGALEGPSGFDDPAASERARSKDMESARRDPSEKGSSQDALVIDPNRPTLRRLNRAEYDNTVRDLLGTTLRPSESFPADDIGYGFDNNGDVLSLSPLQLELYQKAARSVIAQLFEESATGAAMRKKVIPCDPAQGALRCAETSLEALAPRAFRRPLATGELARLVALYELGAGEKSEFARGLSLALEGILLSADFLFRVELDPKPSSTTPHPLNDYELATRLSYFLWSTLPDETLLAAAGMGKLSDPEELAAQTDRLLDDPRSAALTQNFAGQWLLLGGLAEHEVDKAKFPGFDAALRAAMREETARFFETFLRSDLPIPELARADFTFVDARLAKHYGLAAPAQGFQRVSTAETERRGLLGQASFLTVTSHAASTSPVKRGKFVLERLLCSAPADPPPGITPLDAVATPGLTLRERLAEHRTNKTCASCHMAMDPIGLAFEPFDAVGAARALDETGAPVDPAGELPDGRSFESPSELAELIAEDPRFLRCVTEKLFVYALGRGIASGDEPTLQDLDAKLAARPTLRNLVQLVVASEAFRTRRGEAEVSP